MFYVLEIKIVCILPVWDAFLSLKRKGPETGWNALIGISPSQFELFDQTAELPFSFADKVACNCFVMVIF